MRKLHYLLFLIVALILTSCEDPNEQKTVPLESIEFTNIEGGTLTMHPGESFRVRYELVPEELDNVIKLEWESSKESVVEVDEDGKLTALKEGRSNITASYGDVEEEFTVDVVAWEIVDFTLPETLEVAVGTVIQVPVDIDPIGAPVSDIAWEVSDEAYAECFVEDEILYLRGVTPGHVTLSGSVDDIFRSCDITIKENIPLESLEISLEHESICIGETVSATVELYPYNANDIALSWSVSPSGIVSETVVEGINGVSSLQLEGVALGEVTITARDNNSGISAEAILKVAEQQIRSITISYEKYDDITRRLMAFSPDGAVASYGKTAQISVQTEPAGLEDQIIWVNNNEAAVTIDESGLVTAKGHGYSQIYAKAPNGVESDLLYAISVTDAGADWRWKAGSAYSLDNLDLLTSPSTIYTASSWLEFGAIDVNLKPYDNIVRSFFSMMYDLTFETSTPFVFDELDSSGITHAYAKASSVCSGNVTVKPLYGSFTFNIDFAIRSFTLYDETNDRVYKTVKVGETLVIDLSDFDGFAAFSIYKNSREFYVPYEDDPNASDVVWIDDECTFSPSVGVDFYLRTDDMTIGTTYTITILDVNNVSYGSPSFKVKVIE